MVVKCSSGKTRGGRTKSLCFVDRINLRFPFWIFNIVQGNKCSYSSLSGLFFFFFPLRGGSGGLLHVSANCCMLLSQLLCGLCDFPLTMSGKSINCWKEKKRNYFCQMWHWGKNKKKKKEERIRYYVEHQRSKEEIKWKRFIVIVTSLHTTKGDLCL